MKNSLLFFLYIISYVSVVGAEDRAVALIDAIKKNDGKKVFWYLVRGFNVNIPQHTSRYEDSSDSNDEWQGTYYPVLQAVSSKNLPLLKMLTTLQKPRFDIADTMIYTFPGYSETSTNPPLYQAINNNDKAIIEFLLKQKTINPNAFGGKITRSEGLNVVGNPYIAPWVTDERDTPLMLAVKKGDLELAKSLLAHPKTDPFITTEDKRSALLLAIRNDRADMVGTILKHGKPKNKDDIKQLFDAAKNNPQITDMLKKAGL